jgi:hypothetical protein
MLLAGRAAITLAWCSGDITTSFASLSLKTYASPSGGSSVLHGTAIAPRPMMPRKVKIISGESLITSATRSPDPMPCAASAPRQRAACSCTSR